MRLKAYQKNLNCSGLFFGLVIFLVLTLTGCKKATQKGAISTDTEIPTTSEEHVTSDNIPTAVTTSDWMLILVNNTNPIPDYFQYEPLTLDNGRSVDKRIYPSLQAMFDDMRSNGIYPTVSEGYRTADEQQQLMTDKIDAYLHEGYSENEAKKLAEKYVAPVGNSEHQLGLAVDINSDDRFSTDEEVYTWLKENAFLYGFILRYPADKTDITGIEYEPWHYRYVGKEAAKEIYYMRICLEEYVEGLKR